MPYTIEGGFSTKDPDAREKILKAMNKGKDALSRDNIFTAEGWKSEQNWKAVKDGKELKGEENG